MEPTKKINHFRDGLLFKGEIVEGKDGKMILHCECEDKKTKELYALDFTTEQVRIQTEHLLDRLESFLKLYEVGLTGNSNECTLIIVRHSDQVVLSFSYRTDIVIRDFDISFRRFHRDETERLNTIVMDLQNDMASIHMQNNAKMNWKPLKLLNGCGIEGKSSAEAPPSFIYHNRTLHLRGLVRFPEDLGKNKDGIIIGQLPKEYFPLDYMKVYRQPSPYPDDQVTTVRIDIRTNGEIYAYHPIPFGSVYLDGITLLCTK